VEQIVAAARTRDLTVVSRGEDPFTLTCGEVGTLLMRSGHPVAIAADERRSNAARRIAVAWKDSPEAARSISAAMPYLARAQSVVILSALEESRHREEAERSAQRLDRQLQWHGIQTEVRLVEPTRGITPALMDAALKADCDLVVSGAYGHSRMQEFVLGGFTREVLTKAPLPILLFH
jgi:nucleotide-binding universal stress UspA family protein